MSRPCHSCIESRILPPRTSSDDDRRQCLAVTQCQQSTVAGDQLRIENVVGKVSSSPPLVKSMPCKVHDEPTGTAVGTVKFK